mgnify:CR=1 FL=1
MNKNTVVLSLTCLFIGFFSAYFILGNKEFSAGDEPGISSAADVAAVNPFLAKDSDRLEAIEDELELVKQQMHELEYALQNVSASVDTGSALSRTVPSANNRPSPVFNRRIYNIEHLIKGGVDAGNAEDIVRRKNSVELKKLEL